MSKIKWLFFLTLPLFIDFQLLKLSPLLTSCVCYSLKQVYSVASSLFEDCTNHEWRNGRFISLNVSNTFDFMSSLDEAVDAEIEENRQTLLRLGAALGKGSHIADKYMREVNASEEVGAKIGNYFNNTNNKTSKN